MAEQQNQGNQIQDNALDERVEDNARRDEFTVANRDIYKGGPNILEAKASELMSPQMNQEGISSNPRLQPGDLRAGQQPPPQGNNPRDQDQHQRQGDGVQSGVPRGWSGIQNQNWLHQDGQGGNPQMQNRNAHDDAVARGYGRLPRQQMSGGGRHVPYQGANPVDNGEQMTEQRPVN